MFYISNRIKQKDLFGITDTDDGVEEFYNVEQIYNLIKAGIKIHGVAFASERMIIGVFEVKNGRHVCVDQSAHTAKEYLGSKYVAPLPSDAIQ